MGKKPLGVAGFSKGILSVKKSPSEGNTVKSSKKKKSKFIKKNPKEENGTKELRKMVANIKPPKESVSCNWLAFKQSGLYEEKKKSKDVSSSQPKRWKKNSVITNEVSDHKSDLGVHLGSPPTLDKAGDDSHIADLIPKSEAEANELTRCIAVDCEMVGVGDGKESVLARVSLVNQHGACVYDKFVKPKEDVADYRTRFSGVRPSDLRKGEDFEIVQKEVAAMLDGRILVGHAIRNDLRALLLNHPPKMIRDTQRFRPFRDVTKGKTPSLKKLAAEILGVTIQTGEHSSVEDAKATMQLYNLYQKEWEGHRLQKKVLRRKKAIAAARGISKPVTPTISRKASKSFNKPLKNPLMDEFAAF